MNIGKKEMEIKLGRQNRKAGIMIKKGLSIITFGLIILVAPLVLQAKEKTIEWSVSVEVPGEYGEADGYKVYISNQPGIDPTDPGTYLAAHDVGNVLFRVTRFCDKHHYFIITAYNTAGESGASNEIDYIYPACPPQPPPIWWQELITRLSFMRFT